MILLFILSSFSSQLPILSSQLPIHNGWLAVDSVQIPHSRFVTDRFNELYVVTSEEQLFKLNHDNKVEFDYSNSRFGHLASIDVTNPMAISCFYNDYQTVVLLDRTLNPISQINLLDWGFSNVTAVCNAGDNRLWVYDASTMEISKIGNDRKKILHSYPLNLGVDNDLVFSKIQVRNNELLCLSEKGNLFKLSMIGGTLQKILGGERFVDFQLLGDRIVLQSQNGGFFIYRNLLDFKQIPMPYPLHNKESWQLVNDKLFIGDGKMIKSYQRK